MVFQIIASDIVGFCVMFRSRNSVAAENLFLRKQPILT
jgi:hypothetical protein